MDVHCTVIKLIIILCKIKSQNLVIQQLTSLCIVWSV